MRASFGFPEWVSLCFFTFFSALACLRRLEWKRRVNVIAFGAAGTGLILLLLLPGGRALVGFRRILPLILIPMAYWQTGQFAAPLNLRLQIMLARIDRRLLQILDRWFPRRIRHWLRIYGEYAYVFCYPMVPSALAVLYFVGAIEQANEFWSVVLPPAYLSYATLPFVRTMPPRVLEEPREQDMQPASIRRFNLSVVRQVTHQANTFPSGHAAAAVAVALELTRVAPPVGIVYLGIALSIMAGAFVGRYHYATDVLLGAALAAANFLLMSGDWWR